MTRRRNDRVAPPAEAGGPGASPLDPTALTCPQCQRLLDYGTDGMGRVVAECWRCRVVRPVARWRLLPEADPVEIPRSDLSDLGDESLEEIVEEEEL